MGFFSFASLHQIVVFEAQGNASYSTCRMVQSEWPPVAAVLPGTKWAFEVLPKPARAFTRATRRYYGIIMGSKSPLAIGPILLSGLPGRNSPDQNLPTTMEPAANDASITVIQLSDSVNFRVPKCLPRSTSSFLKTYSPFKPPLNVQRHLVHDQDFSSVVSSCLELVTFAALSTDWCY